MSNAQRIYNRLRRAGLTEAAALGMLGNWQAESGLEPNRLQNDCSPQSTLSKAYTADVIAGKISRVTFARDQKGYGLAQWTYYNFSTGQGRKLNLYDFWRKSGKALDDIDMQIDFALHELQTEGQYANLWQILKTTDDIYVATDKICRVFEQPYYLNIDARFRYAKEIEGEINLNGWKAEESSVPEPAEPDQGWEKIPATESWPPRTIDKRCSGWPEVILLQSLLRARQWIQTDPDGLFDDNLGETVKKFQEAYRLDADGVVGKMTWGALGIDKAVFEK